jgi:uncharacterized protein (TIGR02996 family)
MSVLQGLLAGIVSDPQEETRWLVLADSLEEFDDPRRAELLRLHRRLLGTCCEPEQHPERSEWQARIMDLIAGGVRPCVPQETINLPGDVAMTFSFIPPGSFLMGSDHQDGYDNEEPVHRVTLMKGFFMGIYPVTQEQWIAINGTNPSVRKGDKRPVEHVSWNDCQEFCQKLTGHLKGQVTVRLPSEAEWEYACRAGTTTEFHFGDIINSDLANYDGNETWNGSPEGECREETTDVGLFLPNSWGLFDVHGNVWEWSQDWFGPYQATDQTDPQGQASGRSHVLRGGAWCLDPVCCRAAFRHSSTADFSSHIYGFRVCFHAH